MGKIWKFLMRPPRWWTTTWFWVSVACVAANFCTIIVLSHVPGTAVLQGLSIVNLVWNAVCAWVMYIQEQRGR